MAGQDGDGWARCDRGHRHWGRFGAVGLLAFWPGAPADEPGSEQVLLIRRSRWSQHGGTWGPPGGARDSDEPGPAAALREAAEESGLPPAGVQISGMLTDDHGGWSYQTYLADAAAPFPVYPASPEVIDAAWVPSSQVDGLRLHPGFGESWPVLARALTPVSVVVDGANVMGARADGWWRDRAAAAVRLRDQLLALSERGVASLPPALGLPPLDRWFPRVVLVVEGAARAAALEPANRLAVVRAHGSGDDAIAGQAAALPGRRLVVTADRELRRRCEAAGASVTGPGWLLGLL